MPVLRVPHRTPQADDHDGGGEHQEQGDLHRAFEAEPEQRPVQGLVGEAVRPLPQSDAREMVHPVRPRVLRRRGPGGDRGEGEGHARAQRRLPPPGQPEQGGEEQQHRLEGGGEADENARRPVLPDDEPGQDHQQDGQDAGLAQVQGVADRQRQHEQADRDGCREQGRPAAHRRGQRPGRDEADGDDEQQGPERPRDAQALLGRSGERLQDQPGEGRAGEPAAVVQRARHVQDTVLPGPGLQIEEPFPRWLPEHHRHLPYRQHGHDQPEQSPGQPGPRSRVRRRVTAHTVIRIHHVAPTLPPFHASPLRVGPCRMKPRIALRGRHNQPPLCLTVILLRSGRSRPSG